MKCEKYRFKAENAKPCPFCGSESISVIHSELRFLGVNYLGVKKHRMKVYCVCNKCKSRGIPVTYIGYSNRSDYDEAHLPVYAHGEDAISSWNYRISARNYKE